MGFRTENADKTPGTQASLTFSLNIDVGSGNDRTVMIGCSHYAISTSTLGSITGVTVDGQAATLATAFTTSDYDNGFGIGSIYYILDADLPAGSGTYDVVITTSGAIGTYGVVGHAALFDNIAQQAPEGTGKGFSSGSETAVPTASVTTLTDNAIGYGFGGFAYATGVTAQLATGELTSLNQQLTVDLVAFTGRGHYGDGYSDDLGVSGSQSFTLTSDTGHWMMLGAAFEAAGGGPGPGPNMDGAIMFGSFV